MTNLKNSIFWVIGIILILLLVRYCEGEPTTITKIETKYVKVTDTIKNTIIQKVPKIVYVEKTKTIKGKDTIIYKDKFSETTIKANKYETKIESNNANADLQITTTGELLDVQGVINYEKEIKTIETTKTRDASGLFLYGQTNLNGFNNYGVGIDYQLKNKIIIGASVNYDDFNNNINLNVKVGFRIF